jgi:hypothetical protein
MAILVVIGGIQHLARRSCIIVLALALCACVSNGGHSNLSRPAPAPAPSPPPALPPPPSPPRPADGLWAILDPGCAKPDRLDTHQWPRCASPFWISHESALIVGSRPGPKGSAPSASFRVDVRLTAGDPLIVQVGTPQDGYVFLALDKLDRDDSGLLVGAIGSAFACHGAAGGPISLKPITGGCELVSEEELRRAARETLQDETGLSRVAWVAPGAP